MDPGSLPTPVAVPEAVTAPVASFEAPRKVAWYSWRRLGFNFLTLSLLVHVLLGTGAAYLVVSVSAPKKKTFTGPPASGAQHAAEHKVSMAKTQQRSSAPLAVKRVVTTGASKVALPAMPVVSVDNSVVTPVSMSGMGGTGIGGLGTGGNGGGSGGGGGGAPSFFGARTGGKGLVGTFYDFKQTPTHQPTKLTRQEYTTTLEQFVRGGFNEAILARFYKAPQTLFSDRIFTPDIPAELGPAAFGQSGIKGVLWAVHYKGLVVPSESGTFRFAGVGDDVMEVRFDGKLVLEGSIEVKTGLTGQDVLYPKTKLHYTVYRGPKFTVEEGHPYQMDVLMGECPGGHTMADLMIEKDGEDYGRGPEGPLLPIFRLSASTALPPKPPGSLGYIPHAEGGPVWRTVAAAAPTEPSIFTH